MISTRELSEHRTFVDESAGMKVGSRFQALNKSWSPSFLRAACVSD